MGVKLKKGYEVTSLIICDDAREEVTGKWTLVGVYSDSIIVKSLPAKLPRLIFRVAANVSRPAKEIRFKLAKQDGSHKAQIKVPIEGASEGNFVFNFDVRNIKLENEEVFSVLFGIDDEPRQIGKFVVRTPQSEKEKAKLANLT